MVPPTMRLLTALLRTARMLLALVIVGAVLLLVGAGALLHAAAAGHDLTGLRLVVRGVGALLAEQRIERMTLSVTAIPAQDLFSGHAVLTVRTTAAGRRWFYFLLNEGLAVRRVRMDGSEPPAYRLGPLLAVDTGRPLSADEPVELSVEYTGRPAAGLLGARLVFDPDAILLPVDSFWYPADVQSFADVEVAASVPAELVVVHNGEERETAVRGALRTTRWQSVRPIGGMALVAGRYRSAAIESDGIGYRLFFSPEDRLDAAQILGQMAAADRFLRELLGANGFQRATAFVSKDLRRAFNDGSGVIGLTDRYFQQGDGGFGLLAHELAHNWWGATVAEKWLTPGSGGEWLVEGFAELCSILAAEHEHGVPARTLRLTEAFFDPARQRSVAGMSVLDNALAEEVSRDTIYRKGAYVAFMLRRLVGESTHREAWRQLLERFRYQQATDIDVQRVFEEVSGLDLAAFFEDWVRSDRLADLALETTKEGDLEVANHGRARISGEIALWKVRDGNGEADRDAVRVGDRIAVDPAYDHFILDPELHWADVERGNNRFPRRSDPVGVAVSPSGRVLVSFGEPFAWVRSSVRELADEAAEGGVRIWDFARGLSGPIRFGPNQGAAVAAHAVAGPLPEVVVLEVDGSRRTLGFGQTPAPLADGSVVAADGERLIRLDAAGGIKTILRQAGAVLRSPAPSPDGERLAYTLRRGNAFQIRVFQISGGGDDLLLAWRGNEPRYVWSTDGERLYVAVGVGARWQIWGLPIDGGSVQILVAGAVGVADLALSRDGESLAFTAVPEIEYPFNRHRLYVQPLRGGEVRVYDFPGEDLGQLAWAGADTVLVVARELAEEDPWILPARRSLRQVAVAGSTPLDR